MSDKAPTFLFDLDGTLVDSAPDLVAAINETRRDEGLSPVPYEAIRIYASKGAPGLLRAAYGIERDDPTFADRRERFLRHYGDSGFTGSKLYTGIEEMLRTLKESGWRLGVVTNKVEPLAHPLCERLGLMKYLDLVIGSDHEGCAMKPSPSMLLKAMEILQSDPHGTFYAGDDPRDVEAAKAASIPCAACAWGWTSCDKIHLSPAACAAGDIFSETGKNRLFKAGPGWYNSGENTCPRQPGNHRMEESR